MEWRRLRSVLLRLNNRGYGAGRPRNLVSPNMLCRRLLRLDLSAAGPCLEDVNRVEGSEPPQEPWSWEKTDDMLETGNLTAGISTLNSSISLLGNCSAQPYCVAGTSLLRQFLLAAGGSFYVCLPRLDWTMRASSRKRPGILLCRCFNPGNPERRKESAQKECPVFHSGLQRLDWTHPDFTGRAIPSLRGRRRWPTPFRYLLRFAYNPRSTTPAASTKKPTNRSVNPV